MIKKINSFALTGLILGVTSTFRYETGALPRMENLFLSNRASKLDKDHHKYKWIAFVGLGL